MNIILLNHCKFNREKTKFQKQEGELKWLRMCVTDSPSWLCKQEQSWLCKQEQFIG